MQRYAQYTRQSGTASPAGGATVEVFLHETLTLASIFSDNEGPATPKGNPFVADGDGYFFFYAAPGRYDVRVSGVGVAVPYTWADVLLLSDSTVAYLDAENVFAADQAIDGDLTVTGRLLTGSLGVELTGADGRLTALSSDTLADLDGSALTALNASELTQGTLPGGRLAGEYALPVTLSSPENVLAGATLALGALPAATGALRLTFGEAIYARNQANSSDVALLRLSTDDYAILANASAQHLRPYADDAYNFGETGKRWRNGHIKDLYVTGVLTAGDPAEAAAAGAWRLPNGSAWAITWRNAAGSGDLGDIYATAADELYLHFPRILVNDLIPDSDNDEDLGEAAARFRSAYFGTAVLLGTNPATTGVLRLPNASKAVARNAANNADVDLFALDAADWFRVYRKLRYDGPQSTGGGSALLGANSPASTLTAPYTWFQVMTGDGSVGYIPVWK